jgi:hypothetical protein
MVLIRPNLYSVDGLYRWPAIRQFPLTPVLSNPNCPSRFRLASCTRRGEDVRQPSHGDAAPVLAVDCLAAPVADCTGAGTRGAVCRPASCYSNSSFCLTEACRPHAFGALLGDFSGRALRPRAGAVPGTAGVSDNDHDEKGKQLGHAARREGICGGAASCTAKARRAWQLGLCPLARQYSSNLFGSTAISLTMSKCFFRSTLSLS